jgi:hypothetical protein
MLAVSALLLLFAGDARAQQSKVDEPKQPACSTIKSEEMCRVREDCIWVPPAMTFQPRPAHCRAKPVGPPGIITN